MLEAIRLEIKRWLIGFRTPEEFENLVQRMNIEYGIGVEESRERQIVDTTLKTLAKELGFEEVVVDEDY